MHYLQRRIPHFAAATLVLLAATLLPVAPTFAAGWSHDGEGWSGTGTAFLPGGTYVGPPEDAGAQCSGCRWEVAPICEMSGPESCESKYGCPPGQPYAMIFFVGPGGDDWMLQGSQCIQPGEPISVDELATMVTELVRQAAPNAAPGFQPRGMTLTALPTVFWAGQSAAFERSDVLAGIPVRLEANASWSWFWGDGTAPLLTGTPGGQWPDMSVTHVYRKAGTKNALVRTTWDAVFWVNGIGPFPVTGGPVVQETGASVPVREARAVLVER